MNSPEGSASLTVNVGLLAPGPRLGGGRLIISPGLLVCRPGRLMTRIRDLDEVSYTGPRVDTYLARLVPPWFDLIIPVRGEGGTLVATVLLFDRRKVRRALREAGFNVVEHATWIDRGFRLAEMKSRTSANPWNTET